MAVLLDCRPVLNSEGCDWVIPNGVSVTVCFKDAGTSKLVRSNDSDKALKTCPQCKRHAGELNKRRLLNACGEKSGHKTFPNARTNMRTCSNGTVSVTLLARNRVGGGGTTQTFFHRWRHCT